MTGASQCFYIHCFVVLTCCRVSMQGSSWIQMQQPLLRASVDQDQIPRRSSSTNRLLWVHTKRWRRRCSKGWDNCSRTFPSFVLSILLYPVFAFVFSIMVSVRKVLHTWISTVARCFGPCSPSLTKSIPRAARQSIWYTYQYGVYLPLLLEISFH